MQGNTGQVQFNLQSLKEELHELSKRDNNCLVYLDLCLQKMRRENQQIDIYDVIHVLQATFKKFPKQKGWLRQLQTQIILLNNQDKSGSIKLFTKLVHDMCHPMIELPSQQSYINRRKQTQKINGEQYEITQSQLNTTQHSVNLTQQNTNITNSFLDIKPNRFNILNQKDLELAQQLQKIQDNSISVSLNTFLANAEVPQDLTIQQHIRMLHLKNFDDGSGYQVKVFLLHQKTRHIREHMTYLIKYLHQIHSQVDVKNRLRKFWLKRRDNLKQKLTEIYQQKYNPAQLVMLQYKLRLKLQEIMQMCKLFPLKLTSFKTIQIHNISLREKQIEYLKLRLQKCKTYKALNEKRARNLLLFILRCQIVKRKFLIIKKRKLTKFLQLVYKIKIQMETILIKQKNHQNTFISIYTRTMEQLSTSNSTMLIKKYLQYQKMQNQYELQLKRTKLRRISYRKQKIQNGIKTQTRKYYAIIQTYIRIKIDFFQRSQQYQKIIIQYKQSIKNTQTILNRLYQQKQILALQLQLQEKQSLMFQNLNQVVLQLHPPKKEGEEQEQQTQDNTPQNEVKEYDEK